VGLSSNHSSDAQSAPCMQASPNLCAAHPHQPRMRRLILRGSPLLLSAAYTFNSWLRKAGGGLAIDNGFQRCEKSNLGGFIPHN
jgi:hypothetical protein